MKQEKRWIAAEDLFTALLDTLPHSGAASFTVTGMSMWPLMCHGRDQAVIERVSPEQIRRGDIVLLKLEQAGKVQYLLHRVTGVRGGTIQTTGDGNCFRDGWFPRECVVARMTQVIRPNRTIYCDKPVWQWWGRLWMLLYPLRRPIFALWGWIRVPVNALRRGKG